MCRQDFSSKIKNIFLDRQEQANKPRYQYTNLSFIVLQKLRIVQAWRKTFFLSKAKFLILLYSCF